MRIRELVVIVTFVAVLGGCNSIWNGFLDPTQVGRFREKSVMQDLRRSISIADEPDMEVDSVEPTPEDLMVEAHDYILRSGDVIDLSIFELMVPGVPWVEFRQISREGYITLPQIEQDIIASGKTARELQRHIRTILQEEQVLSRPEVTVLVREARNMTFNILGAVGVPRSEIIPRPNFRLLDALASAGGISPPGGPRQPLVKMVYVFRETPALEPAIRSPSPNPSPIDPPDQQMTFGALGNNGANQNSGYWVYIDGEWKFIQNDVPPEPEMPPPAIPEPEPVPDPPLFEPEIVPAPSEPLVPSVPEPYEMEWEQIAASVQTQRVIGIPLDKLEVGDPRYNIVIRDGDTIWVPPPMQGEFFLMGNVFRPGVYSLTGREFTIRQAISSGGGLAPLADPCRVELIRRIGGNMEQVILVNLDRIFAGKEPDIILKPDDIINVGTNPLMPFLAVLRNAFRATYGFGFVYDRNFADVDSFSPRQNPETIRRAEQQQRVGF